MAGLEGLEMHDNADSALRDGARATIPTNASGIFQPLFQVGLHMTTFVYYCVRRL